jgi:hypothetical protein
MTRVRNQAKRTDYRCGPTLPVHSDDEAMLCRRTCGTETWHRRTTLPVITSDGKRYLQANYICRMCEGEVVL